MEFRPKGRGLTRDDLDGLFNEFYPRLFNYMYYRTLNRALSEDLVSTAMVNIVRHYDTYDPKRGNLEQWVFRIGRNVLFSYFRQRREDTGLDSVPESLISYTDDYAALDDQGALVRSLLETLSEDERELVYLKYWEELSNKEIAKRLGLNPSTVSTRLWRATDKMRRAMPHDQKS